MKKILYIISILIITTTFAACNYNELNFPGYDDGVAPTNVFSYKDSLIADDYNSISKMALAVAKNAADTVAAKSIASNKYFTDDAPSYKYIPLWLAKKYLYGDYKSSVMVTSLQYITEEGETQDVKEKYVICESLKNTNNTGHTLYKHGDIYNSIPWERYDAEILSEKFATDLGKFTAVSVAGDQKWVWSSYKGVGFAKMTGYSNGNIVNEDWLISPAMNLTKRKRAQLTFDHTHKYGVDNYASQMTVWVTDNYQTGSTPDTLKWKKLKFNYQYSLTYAFGTSGPVSLNDFIGKDNVRIGFRYQSDAVTSAPTWEVNNFMVMEPEE